MKTTDVWEAHRKLVADAMSPSFLDNVAFLRIYESTMGLVDFWRVKARLALGHPFSASQDIKHSALDIIWVATLGEQTRTAYVTIDWIHKAGGLD
jgi:hypothetical protein